jgi:tRNA(adenine34) deaminase
VFSAKGSDTITIVNDGPSNEASWTHAMREALALAKRAEPDVPVGAIVLDESGLTVGRGYNLREVTDDPVAHAEIVAIREAAKRLGSWRLDGCTLVVTLEPCAMCAGALVQARVARLVFGAYDDKAGAVGSLWDVVRDQRLSHRPEVIAGLLADESAALLRDFFARRR